MSDPEILRCECGTLTVKATFERYGTTVRGSRCPGCGREYVDADDFNRALGAWVAKQCCRSPGR
ncbi:MAG: hypothetical protein J7J06_06845 [Methanosarcinales archaeon]|nr:hypothetical protein [Methanosarcinales archaeon]